MSHVGRERSSLELFASSSASVENRYFNEQERKETLKKKTGKEKLLKEKFAEGK